MGYRFFTRDGSAIREVAQLSDSLKWSGDKRVAESVGNALNQRGIDIRSPEGWGQIAVMFSGGYFWAALDDDPSESGNKGSSTLRRLKAVGRGDLAERLKHLPGKHNQQRHGWRFAKGGDDAAKLGAARRSLRGRDAGERAEYRKRAGMPQVKPLERKQPQPRAAKYPEVPRLKTAGEYADWVTANGYTKAANFDKIHPDDAHEIARSLVENGTDFPIAKASLNYVGTAAGYRKTLEAEAEAAWAKRVEDTKRWGTYRENRVEAERKKFLRQYAKRRGGTMGKNAWAQAVVGQPGGKSILLGAGMESKNRATLMDDLRSSVETGFHPVGTATFKAVIDHEYGHIIDYSYRGRGNYQYGGGPVIDAINSWASSSGGIRKAISAYGAQKKSEAWAEAWAEFRNNPNPRPAATEIGKLILELGKM